MSDLFTKLVESKFNVKCVKEHKFHDMRKWRFDYAIIEYKIAIEIEKGVYTNGRHTRITGFLNDIEKYNTATCDGWRLIRVTPEDKYSVKTFQYLEKLINA